MVRQPRGAEASVLITEEQVPEFERLRRAPPGPSPETRREPDEVRGRWYGHTLVVLFALATVFLLGLYLTWRHTRWRPPVKVIPFAYWGAVAVAVAVVGL